MDVANVMDLDTSRVCRLCLMAEVDMVYIFDSEGHQGFQLWEVIKELLQVEVSEEDGLPGTACMGCVDKVREFKQFKTLCIRTKSTILNMKAQREMAPIALVAQQSLKSHEPSVQIPKRHMDTRNEVQDNYDVDEDSESLSDEGEEIKATSLDLRTSLPTVMEMREDLSRKEADDNAESKTEWSSEQCNYGTPPAINCIFVPEVEEITAEVNRGDDLQATDPLAFGHKEDVPRKSQIDDPVSSPVDDVPEEAQDANMEHFVIPEQLVECELAEGVDQIKTEESNFSGGDDLSADENSDEGKWVVDIDRSVNESANKIHLPVLARQLGFPSGKNAHFHNAEVKEMTWGQRSRIRAGSPDEADGSIVTVTKFSAGITPSIRIKRPSKYNKGKSRLSKLKRELPQCTVNFQRPAVDRKLEEKEFLQEGKPSKAQTRSKPKEGRFKCDVCGELFAFKSVLSRHILSHAWSKEFSCDICGKTFEGESEMLAHSRERCCKKPLRCVVCGEIFMAMANLTRHMRTHVIEKPFACGVCQKTFSRKEHMVAHMRIHKGEKPFHCHDCGKSFTQKGHLSSHMRTHTGEKPFQCNICRKTFSVKCNMLDHLRIHQVQKPFDCNVCNKRFTQKGNLSRHIRVHMTKSVCDQ